MHSDSALGLSRSLICLPRVGPSLADRAGGMSYAFGLPDYRCSRTKPGQIYVVQKNSCIRFLCCVRAVRSDSPASVCASACIGTRCLRCCACLCTCGCHRSRRITDSSRIGGHRDLKQCRHRLDHDRYRPPRTRKTRAKSTPDMKTISSQALSSRPSARFLATAKRSACASFVTLMRCAMSRDCAE